MACVFAGTFDPISVGHENIINKAVKEHKKVFVVLGKNDEKDPFISRENRLTLLKKAFLGNKNVLIFDYENISDYAQFLRDNGIDVYVRGIRNKIDLEYEKKYEEQNKILYPFVKTEYVYCDEEYKNISSTLIREKIQNGEEYLDLLPKSIQADFVKMKLKG